MHIRNLGDEALLQVATDLLGPLPVHAFIPTSRVGHMLSSVNPIQRRALVLGGGTLLNHPVFAKRAALHSFKCTSSFTFGTGVNDPTAGIEGDLKAEVEILRRFDRVAVRGPYSKELLEGAGLCDVDVVGDSAFCLLPANFTDQDFERTAVINYGTINEMCRLGDLDRVEQVFADVALRLIDRGYRIKLLAVRPDDCRPVSRLYSMLPHSHVVAVAAEFSNIKAVQDFVRNAACFFGLKMHAGVIAMSAGVPALIAEYQLKVRDMLEGVGLHDSLLGSREFRPDHIVDKLEQFAADRPRVMRQYLASARAVKTSFTALATEIRKSLI